MMATEYQNGTERALIPSVVISPHNLRVWIDGDRPFALADAIRNFDGWIDSNFMSCSSDSERYIWITVKFSPDPHPVSLPDQRDKGTVNETDIITITSSIATFHNKVSLNVLKDSASVKESRDSDLYSMSNLTMEAY